MSERLSELAQAALGESWWLWDDKPPPTYGPALAFAHEASPSTVLALCERVRELEAALREIAALAGHNPFGKIARAALASPVERVDCKCGHAWAKHQTPGAECVEAYLCGCVTYRAASPVERQSCGCRIDALGVVHHPTCALAAASVAAGSGTEER